LKHCIERKCPYRQFRNAIPTRRVERGTGIRPESTSLRSSRPCRSDEATSSDRTSVSRNRLFWVVS
jgi:hypothetical protein